jgi:hypothetical protein
MRQKFVIAMGVWGLVLATSAEAAPAPAFDLVCTSRSGKPIQLRFDLSQRQWCASSCQAVWAIDQISDAMLTVSMRGNDPYPWIIRINRYTSTYQAIHDGFGNYPRDEGSCETRAFSGFPRRKF